MDWKTMLAYITGSVDQELLLRSEYLVAENRILRNQLPSRLHLSDGERRTLAEIGKQLGKRALSEVASIVRPETILGWHRRLVAKKFDITRGIIKARRICCCFQPPSSYISPKAKVRSRERLGGLLRFYHREAA